LPLNPDQVARTSSPLSTAVGETVTDAAISELGQAINKNPHKKKLIRHLSFLDIIDLFSRDMVKVTRKLPESYQGHEVTRVTS
jgi:hypothetical protein